MNNVTRHITLKVLRDVTVNFKFNGFHGHLKRRVRRGAQFPGRWKARIMLQVLLQYSTFASEGPQVRTWGGQTCFLPRAPHSFVTPLLLNSFVEPLLRSSVLEWGLEWFSYCLVQQTDSFIGKDMKPLVSNWKTLLKQLLYFSSTVLSRSTIVFFCFYIFTCVAVKQLLVHFVTQNFLQIAVFVKVALPWLQCSAMHVFCKKLFILSSFISYKRQ